MSRKAKPAATVRNTRALARRLFPTWSRAMQARWVLARLRASSGTWAFPIGSKHVVEQAPDFLRIAPRHGGPLHVAHEAKDTVRDIKRFARRLVRS